MHFYLNPGHQTTSDINLVLVMDYHPNFKDVPKLIKDHLQILYESPHMKKVFSSSKTCIRTGFQRTKNLKDLLVPSALPYVNSVEVSVVMHWAAFNVIERSVMFATIFYFQ